MKAQFKCQDDRAEVWIYGDIGDSWGDGIEAKPFIDELQTITASTITVRINSPGGDVFDAVAMYHALIRHPARIEVEVDALAASAASLLAMAGDSIRVAEGGFIMLHNPFTMAVGTADDFRKMAETLDKVQASIRDTYAARSKTPADEVQAWLDAETWFTAEDAVEMGLADEMGQPMKVAASLDKRRFRRVPESLAAKIDDQPGPAPCHWRLAYAERVLQLMGESA